MKIVVDRSRCSSIGMCESIAEDYFEIGDDGALELLREHLADADIDRVEEAVRACPTEALSIVDD